MTAYVNIAVAERKDVLLVANAALRFKPSNADSQTGNGAALHRDSVKPKDEKRLSGHPRDGISGKVYVLEQGELKPVSVSLGITDNRNTEIVAGELKAGDQIVVGEAQDKPNSSSSKPPMRLF